MSSNKNIEILDQDVDDDGSGTFRVRVGNTVRYLNVEPGTFFPETMYYPSALVPQLPPLPSGRWTDMDISRDRSGQLVTETWTFSHDGPVVHRHSVDVLALKTKEVIRSGVYKVLWEGGLAIAKYACFHQDLPRIAHEAWAYAMLEQAYKTGALQRAIAPRFLCQITENGRPMGVLLEKLEGGRAGIEDLYQCEAVVRQLHAVGIVHGDLNRHNFIVDRRGSSGGEPVVRLIDFERAEAFDAHKAAAELASLPGQLADESGRGGTFLGF